jgi:hypothetical protein
LQCAGSAALVLVGVCGFLLSLVTCTCECSDTFFFAGVGFLAAAWFASLFGAPLAGFRWWRAQQRWRREHPTLARPYDATEGPALVFIASIVALLVTAAFALVLG